MQLNFMNGGIAPSMKLALLIVGIVLVLAVIVMGAVAIICHRRKKLATTKVFMPKKYLYIYSTVFIICLIYSFTLMYPFFWLTVNSLKQGIYIFETPFAFPNAESFVFTNYIEAFTTYNILEMFWNSISLTVGGTVVSCITCTMAGYIMAKYQFKGKEIMHTAIILSMTIPTLGSLPATYRLMLDLNLFDTYLGLMLMWSGGFGGHYLYMFAFFKGISWSYAESAMIDGASNVQIFLKIMVPLAMPIISTIAILKALGFWNEYWMTYLFYGAHPTLAVGLNSMKIKAESRPLSMTGPMFAMMMVSVIPVVIFYICCQKRLMTVTIGGGIKG